MFPDIEQGQKDLGRDIVSCARAMFGRLKHHKRRWTEKEGCTVGGKERRHLHVLLLGDGEFQSHTAELKVTI